MKSASKSLQKKINELSSIKYSAFTIISKCRSCGTCIKFCPLKIRAYNSEGKAITIITEKSCGGCSVCFKRCPYGAIQLIPIIKKE
ncbi:MAG: 4Fe-4S dicluster domain-containing protein [Promethearchaeota archaeon]